MACYRPILAVDYGLMQDGKHLVKVFGRHKGNNDTLKNFRKKFGNKLMMLPCGNCVGCAKDYARTWQARLMAEAEYHSKKCFITLTYKNAPENPSKDDVRVFLKNLRNKYGQGIKFFCAGEKGSVTNRSHYHLILFGVDFSEDRVVIARRGLNDVFRSPSLEKIWDKGFSSIGSLDISSAGYVSQYCNKKKISGDNNGEFVIMSRGLGKQYFIDNKDKIFNSDYIYFDGNKFKFPRYFLKLAHSSDFYTRLLADDYSDRKRKIAQSFRYDNNRSVVFEEEGMKESEIIAIDKLHHKEGDVRDVI